MLQELYEYAIKIAFSQVCNSLRYIIVIIYQHSHIIFNISCNISQYINFYKYLKINIINSIKSVIHIFFRDAFGGRFELTFVH